MKITIIGPGVMGKGIAQVCAQRHTTFLVGNYVVEAEQAKRDIERTLQGLVKKGKITERAAKKTLDNIVPSLDTTIKGSDLIIEAVPENAALKKKIYKNLSKRFPKAIIATNTSSISISALAKSCTTPSRFIGMHFFNPAPVMPLVEIIRGKQTSEATYRKAVKIVKGLKKQQVTVKDHPGFIVNHLVIPMINDATELLRQGVASKEDIDRAAKLGLHHPMGPLELGDFIGLDVVLDIQKELHKRLGARYKPSSLLTQMVKQNRLGRKTKKGFYTY